MGPHAVLRIVSPLLLLSVCHCGSSEKKGYGISFKRFLCGDFEALGQINWWYDWHLNPFYYDNDDEAPTDCPGLDKYDATHKSMLWGWNPKKAYTYVLSPGATVLMGANEPNHMKQSNMTPEMTAELWPQVQTISNGLPLITPSASPCGGDHCYGNTLEWFDRFFNSCKDCRFDHLATHLYICNADNVMRKLEELYDRYNLTIWLTEFACPRSDPDVVLNFMQQVLPKLEAAPYVARCVDEDLQPFALGLSWLLLRLLGSIPGPVLIGSVIDSACLIWAGGICGTSGNCVLYSKDKLSLGVLLWWVITSGVTSLLFFISSILASRVRKAGAYNVEEKGRNEAM